ncbi:MAG: hypothetical protein WD449_00970 [Candidatus Babeliales bacterium]
MNNRWYILIGLLCLMPLHSTPPNNLPKQHHLEPDPQRNQPSPGRETTVRKRLKKLMGNPDKSSKYKKLQIQFLRLNKELNRT